MRLASIVRGSRCQDLLLISSWFTTVLNVVFSIITCRPQSSRKKLPFGESFGSFKKLLNFWPHLVQKNKISVQILFYLWSKTTVSKKIDRFRNNVTMVIMIVTNWVCKPVPQVTAIVCDIFATCFLIKTVIGIKNL